LTPIPAPFDLARGDYALTTWSAMEPAGTYPSNMVFLQTAALDPGLSAEPDAFWTLPYDRASRSRSRIVNLDLEVIVLR